MGWKATERIEESVQKYTQQWFGAYANGERNIEETKQYAVSTEKWKCVDE